MDMQRGVGQTVMLEYDFAVDGGAVGVIPLRFAGSKEVFTFATNTIIRDVIVDVVTAFTSGGTPTATLGNVDDPDGFFVDMWALLAAGTAIKTGNLAGAKIWDNTNDNVLPYRVGGTNMTTLDIAVGTAAITAGKAYVYLDIIARPDIA